MKLDRKKGIGFEDLDKTIKKDFTKEKKKPEEDKDQALESTMVGEKHTEVSEDISLSRK